MPPETDTPNQQYTTPQKGISICALWKDTEGYLGILCDANTRKWICRIRLGNRSTLIIPVPGEKDLRLPIESLDDLYQYSDQLIDSARRFCENN